MAEGIQYYAEPLRSLDYASTGASYVAVGTAVVKSTRQFIIQNLTDATMVFSFDGTNDHFVLPANGFFTSDVTANKVLTDGFFLSAGTKLYVKRIGTPTTGTIYFSTFNGVR